MWTTIITADGKWTTIFLSTKQYSLVGSCVQLRSVRGVRDHGSWSAFTGKCTDCDRNLVISETSLSGQSTTLVLTAKLTETKRKCTKIIKNAKRLTVTVDNYFQVPHHPWSPWPVLVDVTWPTLSAS